MPESPTYVMSKSATKTVRTILTSLLTFVKQRNII